jgi:hypothetical protein
LKEVLMVYGLNVKPEHGMDWDFEPLDGDFRKVGLVDESPDDGINPRGRPFTSGRAVDPANVPTKVQWKDRHSPRYIPDFSTGPFLHVSARAKALIEEFEPGVHQFLPVEFVDIDGNFLENRWFLAVCNRLDSLDREHTKGMLRIANGSMWIPVRDLIGFKDDLIPPDTDLAIEPKMVFSRIQIASAHMWCDKHLTGGGPFISDALATAIKAKGLTGLRLGDSGVENV